MDFDAIVVGGGAAGGAITWQLSRNGLKVACLERGPWMQADTYPSTAPDWELQKRGPFSPLPADRNSLYDYPIDDSDSPIAMCNFNAVGGSTILYSGHFPRFRPHDFNLRSTEGLGDDWPISYEDLKPFYELNEAQMNVSGLAGDPAYPDIENLLPPVPIGTAGERIARAFNSLGWHWWPSYAAISTVARDERSRCINLGPCNTGCPQGAKSSADITYMAKARQLGAVIMSEAAVSRVLTNGSEATGVEYYDDAAQCHHLSAKRVILAASAAGTPRILLNSTSDTYPNGLGNANDQVGRHLMVHPLGFVEGVFDETLDTDVGPQGCMIYSLEHYRSPDAEHDLGYMLHVLRGTGPLEAARAALQRRQLKFGPSLYDDFEAYYRRQLAISVICEDLPSPGNRIRLDASSADRFGVPGIKVDYRLQDNARRMMTHGMGSARKVLIEAGARRTFAYGPVRNTGWHIMGTCRMGDDRSTSVVDATGKCHDLDNLFIADSSVFPTGSCVNPANTIQALALHIGQQIVDRGTGA
jgi:choline dehydrogenase-like flavoprotein